MARWDYVGRYLFNPAAEIEVGNGDKGIAKSGEQYEYKVGNYYCIENYWNHLLRSLFNPIFGVSPLNISALFIFKWSLLY